MTLLKALEAVVNVYKNTPVMPDIALLCFEKPGIFCHRHLVAYWLNDHGIECLEWQGE